MSESTYVALESNTGPFSVGILEGGSTHVDMRPGIGPIVMRLENATQSILLELAPTLFTQTPDGQEIDFLFYYNLAKG